MRILIVRLSAIGDCLLSVPVLTSLRRNFPEAQIGWVIERAGASLIEGHSALDELFVLSKQTFKSPVSVWKLGRQLRSWKPDVTIDLQGLTKSSLLAWLSGAKVRIGFHKDQFDGRELSTWFNNRLFRPESKHIVRRNLDILGLLGIPESKVEYDLPENAADAAFADKIIAGNHFDGRFAVINVGAGWVSKIWPSTRYASVASRLDKHWGIPSLVVWSGEKEREAAQAVCKEAGGNAHLAPDTSLKQLSSLIRRASLFVGSDTGPMHLSVALGTPTVGMIGPMPLERVGPLGASHIGIQKERLPDGQHSDRKTNCKPMLSISTDDVIEACDSIVNRLFLADGKVA